MQVYQKMEPEPIYLDALGEIQILHRKPKKLSQCVLNYIALYFTLLPFESIMTISSGDKIALERVILRFISLI